MHFPKSGIQIAEWTRGAALDFEPLARTTELDATKQEDLSVLDRAASVLLALQSPDGGWHNPVHDVITSGGENSQYDMNVPRTALVVDALLALRAQLPERNSELEKAAHAGIALVGRFADAPKPWVWHATYALHLQAEAGATARTRGTRRRPRSSRR